MTATSGVQLDISGDRPPVTGLANLAEINTALAQLGAGVWPLDLSGAPRDIKNLLARPELSEGEKKRVLDHFLLRDAAAVEETLVGVHEAHGSLDVLVCTPAVNVRKQLLDYTDEEFDRVIELNLKGGLHAMQSAGRIMKEQGAGSIIMFSSIRSLMVEPGQGVYAATKAGIVQMVRTLAAELGPHGVRVNAVAPGVVETPLTEPIKADPDWFDAYAARNVLGRWAQPEEMVGATVFLASDAASYVTGSVVFVDAGWTATDGRFSPPGM